MELNQLKYFKKVAQEGSVTRAAQELFISQSTLSQCLSRLEESIGCPLFMHQPGRPMQLNEAGKVLEEVVDRVLFDLEQGIEQVRKVGLRCNTQVSIASSVYDICNQILLDVFDQIPGIKVSQQMTSVNSLTGLLLNNEVDFSLSPCPLIDPKLDCYPLYVEESLAAVGPDHPFYGRKYITLEELKKEKFICNYAEADRLFLEMLFDDDHADIVMESNEPSTINNLVEKGVGIAFVPARIVMRRIQYTGEAPERFVRIKDFKFTVPTCISKKKMRCLTKEARQMYDYIVNYCRKESHQVEKFLKKYY